MTDPDVTGNLPANAGISYGLGHAEQAPPTPSLPAGSGSAAVGWSDMGSADPAVVIDDSGGDSGLYLVAIANLNSGEDYANADGTLHLPAGVYLLNFVIHYPSYPGSNPAFDGYMENGNGGIRASRAVGSNRDLATGIVRAVGDDRFFVGFDNDPTASGAVVRVFASRLGDST